MDMPPTLITGASGFLGEHLVRCLAARGRAVVGTYLAHSVAMADADLVPVDLCDGAAVRRLVRDLRPSAVVHCAALTDAAACERDEAAARAGILDATRNICSAVGEFVPNAPLLALSTDLVFDGEAAPYAANSLPKPLSVYGSLKWQAESPVLALPRGIVVRTALMYGPPTRHKGSFLAWMIGNLAAGKHCDLFEDEVRTPIYVDDLCAALVALTDGRKIGLWHAGGPERLDRMAMGRLVCREFGFDENLLVPTRLADSQYGAARPRDVSLDSAATWAAVGVVPRDFAEGLRSVREALSRE